MNPPARPATKSNRPTPCKGCNIKGDYFQSRLEEEYETKSSNLLRDIF